MEERKENNKKYYEHNTKYLQHQLENVNAIKPKAKFNNNDSNKKKIAKVDNSINRSIQKTKNITITPVHDDTEIPIKIIKNDLNYNSCNKSHNEYQNFYRSNEKSIRKTRDNRHFFKTKIDYQSGMVQKARKELELFRKQSIDHDEEKMKKRKMLLNMHKIDYSLFSVTTEENNKNIEDDKDKNKEANNAQYSINQSNSQRQGKQKKVLNQVKIEPKLSSSHNSSMYKNLKDNDNKEFVRRNERKTSNKQKIDYFEYIKKINPKFALKSKTTNNTLIIQTASPLKVREYPSMILRQFIQKHNNKDKDNKLSTEKKGLKIMINLNKIDEYIKKNLFNPIHQSQAKKLNQEMNRSDSIETIVSSNDFKDQIKACKMILFQNDKQVLMH